MSLQNFCRKPLVKVSPDTNITKACRLMAKNNVGCLVAEKDGELCGIITDRDIAETDFDDAMSLGSKRSKKILFVLLALARDQIDICV